MNCTLVITIDRYPLVGDKTFREARNGYGAWSKPSSHTFGLFSVPF